MFVFLNLILSSRYSRLFIISLTTVLLAPWCFSASSDEVEKSPYSPTHRLSSQGLSEDDEAAHLIEKWKRTVSVLNGAKTDYSTEIIDRLAKILASIERLKGKPSANESIITTMAREEAISMYSQIADMSSSLTGTLDGLKPQLITLLTERNRLKKPSI